MRKLRAQRKLRAYLMRSIMVRRKTGKAASRRRRGVDKLVARGWTKRLIAEETGIALKNFRYLLNEGGEYSEQGKRLDFYLEKHGAFDPAADYGPADARDKPLMRDSTAEYDVQRTVNLPSAHQLEDAIYRAHLAKDMEAVAELQSIQDDVMKYRSQFDKIERRFLKVVSDLETTDSGD